jgi:hypothetical protein
LRAEGARPESDEPVPRWARRVRARFVAQLEKRVFARAADPRVASWPALAVERVASDAQALSRGFLPIDMPSSAVAAPRRRRAARPRLARLARLEARLRRLDSRAFGKDLDERGWARVPAFVSAAECRAVGALFEDEPLFERTIDMAPRGYGVGRYRYFREPAPSPIAELRAGLYRALRPRAEEWMARVAGAGAAPLELPAELSDFFARCREARQERGSSIVLVYEKGGVNHPHQDVYGPVFFPFQALIVLSRRGRDFRGGAFQWIEEHPDGREVRREVPASVGDLVVFCSSARLGEPGRGGRAARVPVRHGMSLVTHGERRALGIVFHLAK